MDIKQQIEIQLKKYLDAFNYKKWDEFGGHIDDDFKYFTDTCVIQNKEEFISYLSRNSWDASGYTISDLSVTSSKNEDLAIASYKAEFTGIDAGEKLTLKAIETTVFSKRNGGWKIIHSHTSNKF